LKNVIIASSGALLIFLVGLALVACSPSSTLFQEETPTASLSDEVESYIIKLGVKALHALLDPSLPELEVEKEHLPDPEKRTECFTLSAKLKLELEKPETDLFEKKYEEQVANFLQVNRRKPTLPRDIQWIAETSKEIAKETFKELFDPKMEVELQTATVVECEELIDTRINNRYEQQFIDLHNAPLTLPTSPLVPPNANQTIFPPQLPTSPLTIPTSNPPHPCPFAPFLLCF
jgi:hypothetical protein